MLTAMRMGLRKIFQRVSLVLAGLLANTTDLRAAIPAAPSDLIATFTSATSLTLSWADNSTDETEFDVYYRTSSTANFSLLAVRAANVTTLGVSGLPTGTPFQFIVVAFNDVPGGGGAATATLSVTTPGITSRAYQPTVVGQAFDVAVAASSSAGAPDSVTVTGTLPAGLAFDAAAQRIRGTPTQAGVFTVSMNANYAAFGTLAKTLTLRVILPPAPPLVTAQIPAQAMTATGAVVSLVLDNFFADPDTEQAVRFDTTKGIFDVALYATATPLTVSNFLNYANRGDYSNSVVHRAVTNFIVQGGGFKSANPNFTSIPTNSSPLNEPGIANLRGTIAMAKMAGNPNSATSQWFVNVADNTANLDNQNGGFTAFGRVCGNGLAVADAIAALPTTSYVVPVNGGATQFDDVPVDTTNAPPPALDFAKLVLVNSVTRIAPLSYRVTENLGPAITATVVGTNLLLTPSSALGGTNFVTIAATDLDGNSVTQAFAVVVTSAFSDWAQQNSLSGTNALVGGNVDGDRFVNAVEFALLGAPALNDGAAIAPRGSVVTVGAQRFLAATFKLRKVLGGFTVTLNAADAVASAPWTTVWTDADLAGAQVTQRTDGGDHWLLTVRDAQPLGAGATRRFLQVVVGAPR